MTETSMPENKMPENKTHYFRHVAKMWENIKRIVLQVLGAIIEVATTIWITFDQVSDCWTTYKFYKKHFYGWFIASLVLTLSPGTLAFLVFGVYQLVTWSVSLWNFCGNRLDKRLGEGCCSEFNSFMSCLCVFPLTLLAATLFGFAPIMAFAVFPLLQFILGLFKLWGIGPLTEKQRTDQTREPKAHPIQTVHFTKLWVLVKLLRIFEALVEAPGQVILNSLYLFSGFGRHSLSVAEGKKCEAWLEKLWKNETISWWDKALEIRQDGQKEDEAQICGYYYMYISMGLSVGSLLIFIAHEVYQVAKDYDHCFYAMAMDVYLTEKIERNAKRNRVTETAEEQEDEDKMNKPEGPRENPEGIRKRVSRVS